jgi:hypothetical protein
MGQALLASILLLTTDCELHAMHVLVARILDFAEFLKRPLDLSNLGANNHFKVRLLRMVGEIVLVVFFGTIERL